MFQEIKNEDIMIINGGTYGYAERFENSKPFPEAVVRVIGCIGEVAYFMI